MKGLNTKKIIGGGIRCWRICIDLFIIGLGIYSIYYDVFDIEYLIRCIKILCILLLYGFIAYNLGLGSGSRKEYIIDGLYKISKKKNFSLKLDIPGPTKRLQNHYRFNFLCIKYTEILVSSLDNFIIVGYLKFFRFIIYIMPWMWLFLILCYLNIFFYYVKIIINGIIDIGLRRYFFYYWDKTTFSYENKWGYKMFVGLIKYPVLRILFYPLYIRIRIINKDGKDLIRIRFIAYFYVIFLVFLGYEDLIYYVKNHTMILFLIIYVYFTVLLPLIFFFIAKVDPGRYDMFLYPSLSLLLITYKQYTITLTILLDFFLLGFWPSGKRYIYFFESCRIGIFKIIDEKIIFSNRVYIVNKCVDYFNVYDKVDRPNVIGCYYGDDKLISYETVGKNNYNLYIQKNLWRYEKYYHIPCFINELLFSNNNILKCLVILEGLGQEAIARHGVMFMHYEYGDAYEQTLDLFRCGLFFIFDLQRLCGIKFDINGDLVKQLYNFKIELTIDDVPLRFALLKNMKLYMNIKYMMNFFINKKLIFVNGLSYIPEIFAMRIGCFRSSYKNLDDYVQFVKRFSPPIHECVAEGIMKLSLLDKIEIITPGFVDVYLTYRFSHLVNYSNEESDFCFIQNYKFFLQKDFIKLIKSEYDNLNISNIRDISISKESIIKYNKKYLKKNRYSIYLEEEEVYRQLDAFLTNEEDKNKLV